MTLRILTADDVRSALPMAHAIEAMCEAFLAVSEGRADMPLRTALELPSSSVVTLCMPASVEGVQALGAKLVSVCPENEKRNLPLIHGIVALIDWETGRPAAVLDGMSLTAIRTGAASGLATRMLAREDAGNVAIIGSGVQARTQLEAVCTVRQVGKAAVYSRTRANAERFASDMAGTGDVPDAIEVCDSPAAAVEEADIVCVATSSSVPVLAKDEVPEGAHINAVGSFTPEMLELDPQLVASSRVVVDQREAALAEAGEVIAAADAGLISESDLVELGDIVAGKAAGRFGADDMTLFKSVGLAVQDMCAAKAALERAVRENLGSAVQL